MGMGFGGMGLVWFGMLTSHAYLIGLATLDWLGVGSATDRQMALREKVPSFFDCP